MKRIWFEGYETPFKQCTCVFVYRLFTCFTCCRLMTDNEKKTVKKLSKEITLFFSQSQVDNEECFGVQSTYYCSTTLPHCFPLIEGDFDYA